MDDENLDRDLRRLLKPVEAGPDFVSRLARIPEARSPRTRPPAWSLGDWRWLLGMGLAGAIGIFALGLWLGGSIDETQPDGLALLAGSELAYMEELL